MFDLYRVDQVIRSGGMGIVYRVRHLGWDTDLAVKAPRPELLSSDAGRRFFEREAESWVGLGPHPHTVSCAYVRRHENLPLVFAEWVPGGSLAEAIADRRLYAGDNRQRWARLLDLAVQIVWGLRHAHAAGLIHQDLKPANILLAADGTAKITDFGLARGRALAGAGTGAGPDATLAATYGGHTPAYCSPEQDRAGRGAVLELTRATDVWSWAVTVLELFAGERVTSTGPAAGQALGRYADALPPRLADLLGRCLEPEPARRAVQLDDMVTVLVEAYRDVTGSAYARTQPTAARLRADGLNNRALSRLDLGQGEESERIWAEALRVEPHHRPSVYNLGLRRWRSGRITDAALVAELEAAADGRADDAVHDHFTGLVRLESGDLPAARMLLSRAARIAPGAAEYRAAAERVAATTTGHTEVAIETSAGRLMAVTVTPDGRFAAATSCPDPSHDPRIVEVWARDGRRLCRVEAPIEGTIGTVVLEPLALSADGSTVACGVSGGWAYVWDVGTGRRRAAVPLTDDPSAVALSSDGGVVAVATEDCAVMTWDVAGGRPRHRLQRPDPYGRSGSFVDTALRFDAAAGAFRWTDSRGRVRSWELATGFLSGSYPVGMAAGQSGRRSVMLSADGATAVLTWDGGTEVWDLADARRRHTAPPPPVRPDGGAVDAAGRQALLGHQGVCLLWEPATRRVLRTLQTDATSSYPTALSADGATGVTGGPPGSVRLWSNLTARGPAAPWWYARPHSAMSLNTEAAAVRRALEATAAGSREPAATGAAVAVLRAARAVPGHRRDPELLDLWVRLGKLGHRVALLDAWPVRELTAGGFAAPAVATHYEDGENPVIVLTGQVAVTGDGRRAVTAGAKTADVWDTRAGAVRTTIDVRPYEITAIACDDAGAMVLTASRDGVLGVWDPETGRCRHALPGAGDIVQSIVISPDGRLAVTRNQDGGLRLWDPVAGRRLDPPPGLRAPIRAALPAAHGEFVVVADAAGLHVWEPRTRRFRPDPDSTGGGRPLALSADDRLLLAREPNGRRLRVWDLDTGRTVSRLTGHPGPITAGRLSADGRTAVTADANGSLRVWDTDSGRCRHVLPGHPGHADATAEEEAPRAPDDEVIRTVLQTTRVSARYPLDTRSAKVHLVAGDRFAVSTGPDGVVRTWDLHAGRELIGLGRGQSVAAGRAERFVLVRDGDTARLWELDWDFDFPATGAAQTREQR
ncbi:putative serine/threonine protein kinase [Actinoplanes missouriensis 431]|uniref:Putative serine/threonine protein kinase n=2 Tax=Actinoplanes missouriensis TaxID=1866 RepID=I0H4Q0_ACTM4|nr:putative serine/threonine protein kinase [Actinoplanes missouriensis 431]